MIKAEYGIKAANLVWLIWDNTKKSPSCLFHWMTGGEVSLLTIWKHCDCGAITMLLGGKSYAFRWWKHSYCPAVSVLAFCQKIVILDGEKVSICKWWWSISWLLVLFSFLLFLECILSWCHSVLFLEQATEGVFTVVPYHFCYFDMGMFSFIKQFDGFF